MRKILFSIIAVLAITILFSTTAHAEFSNSKCSKVLTHSGDIQISRDYDADSRVCFISIHPMNVTDLKYRDYYFNNQGLFLVFNSYGEGSNTSATGGRVFYMFPIVDEYPDYAIQANGDVIVKTSSGHLFTFEAKKLALKSISSGSVIEKPLSNSNKGGIEIKLTRGLWFDSGFRFGGMANEKPSGATLVNGSAGGQCQVKNSEIFDYSNDIAPKYNGNALLDFIKKRCPQVKF